MFIQFNTPRNGCLRNDYKSQVTFMFIISDKHIPRTLSRLLMHRLLYIFLRIWKALTASVSEAPYSSVSFKKEMFLYTLNIVKDQLPVNSPSGSCDVGNAWALLPARKGDCFSW